MKFLSVEPGGIPDELKDINRWVVWRAISRDGKPTKRPFKVNGKPASVTDSSTWVGFKTAQAVIGSGFDGIGLVLNGDGIVGLDFDHCRCPGLDGVDDGIANSLGMVDPEIAQHLKDMNGYTEVSPSGRGIRVIVRGTLPVERRKKKGPIELYSSGRYVTLTGHVLDGFPRDIPTRTVELQAFYKRIFGEAGGEKAVKAEAKLSFDRHERLKRAFSSKNGEATKALYDGDHSGYPSRSEADLALASHLAFWLDGDTQAMDAAFRQSGLMRPKWDEKRGKETYGEMTIAKALERRVSQTQEGEIPSKDILEALGQNEDGDAHLFSRLHKGRLIFDHAEGKWYRWRDHHWEPDPQEQSLAGISEVCEIYAEEMRRNAMARIESTKCGETGKAEGAKRIEDALGKRIWALRGLKRKQAVIHLAKVGIGSLGVSGDGWDQDPWALPVQNGVVDLHTGRLRDGTPEDLFKTFASAEWKGLDAPCPRWEGFLGEIFDGDPDLVAFVNRLLGYAITGLTREHTFTMLWGIGRNGKSTFIEAIGHALGTLAGQGDPELVLESRFNRVSGAPTSDIMALRGKRLVWVPETSKGRQFSPGKLKWLTGGDTLTGREVLGKHQVSFRPSHTLFMLTNFKPRANAEDFSLWSRVLLVPFNLCFMAEPDPSKPAERKLDADLLDKLKREAPGILAWLVRGCLAWQREGLAPPTKVKMATAQYQQDEDILRRFIEEKCTEGPEHRVTARAFYEAYARWAKASGEMVVTAKEFGGYMTKRFRTKRGRHDGQEGKIYLGVRPE